MMRLKMLKGIFSFVVFQLLSTPHVQLEYIRELSVPRCHTVRYLSRRDERNITKTISTLYCKTGTDEYKILLKKQLNSYFP